MGLTETSGMIHCKEILKGKEFAGTVVLRQFHKAHWLRLPVGLFLFCLRILESGFE